MKFLLVFVFALAAVGAWGSAHPSNLEYMVKLEVSKAGQCSVCSGSFIDTNWILTAAHCVHGMDSVIAYVGPQFEGNCSTGYEIDKNLIMVHELFREANQSTYRYDIALIKFTPKTSCRPIKPVQFLNGKPRRQIYRNESVAFVQFSSACGQSPALLSVQPVTGNLHCPPELILRMVDGPMEEKVMCVPALDYGGSCNGDTSTHLIMGNTDGELIGIMTSPNNKNCGTHETITSDIIFTNLYQYKSWIIKKVKTAAFSSMLSMVRLDIFKGGKRSVCSGSFVNKNWILTAAHCVHDAKSVVVDVGRHFNSHCPVSYAVNKSQIIIHPSFNMEYAWNGMHIGQSHDIALIKFMEETSCKRYWIVSLPSENDQRSYYNERTQFIRFMDLSNTSPPKLFTKFLRVLDDNICMRTPIFPIGVFNMPIEEPMEEDQMCIFYRLSKRSCFGDTSGHLFKRGTAELIGIMSRQPGQGCRYANQITSTRVSYYVGWIKSHFT